MSFIVNFVHGVGFFTWDTSLTIMNFILPKRSEGKVTPEGHPGFGGKWPEFIPPTDGDSRCACPGLNAMANHGIIAHDGKNIGFKELDTLIYTTFNFSPSFCNYTVKFAAKLLGKDYEKGSFDLEEISVHNGIEHDGSLCREDTALCPDQRKPQVEFVKELLASATGKDKDGHPLLTRKDISYSLSRRRAESRAINPEYSLAFDHRMFSCSNSSTLLTIFGGRVKDLETILIEERLPEGWESRVRRRYGLTIATLNLGYSGWVEFRVNEKKYLAEKAAKGGAAIANNETEATEGTSSINKVDSPTN